MFNLSYIFTYVNNQVMHGEPCTNITIQVAHSEQRPHYVCRRPSPKPQLEQWELVRKRQ